MVTGGARRVGRAIALRLARRGCHIALHHLTSKAEAQQTAAECRAAGGQCALIEGDLADPATAARLVEETLAHFGRLDVLVNNASVFPRMTIDAFDLAEWQRTLQINLTSIMQLVHAARQPLRHAHGRVINLCDVATTRPWPDHLAYITSKGALDTLTRALARALAPEVNVVGIAPGVAVWPEAYDQKLKDRLLQRIPLRRAGSEEDIAALVEFVLREGDYITGAIMPVDGGRHIV